MIREFVYGQYVYKYEFIRQERKTLSLTVRPDMSIVLKCPVHAGENRINLFLKRKWSWLNKQLNFFKKFQKEIYKREYVSGESFIYLGRQYQLIVNQVREDRVSLTKGRLLLGTQYLVDQGAYNKKLIEKWFKERAEIIFQERFKEVRKHFNYSHEIKLYLRKMNKRWGSFFDKHKIKSDNQCGLFTDKDECEKFYIWNRKNEAKKNLMEPADIDYIKDAVEPKMSIDCSVMEDANNKEIIKFIENKLPQDLRSDWLRMKTGTAIPKHRRDKVIQKCKEIVEGING